MTHDLRVSVIIPTHNRPNELQETLAALHRQTLTNSEYEVIIVDDGSFPAVVLPAAEASRSTLVRLEGSGRSTARNMGASTARGGLLVFIDDDVTVGSGFLAAHLRGQEEWPDALCTGEILLPERVVLQPFGRFRQDLERSGIPRSRGPMGRSNFCAAGNMSIARAIFHALGGFAPAMASGEDQDLALRHTSAGGRVAYLPDAGVIHRDGALDVRSYCRRHEWGAEHLLPFVLRYPESPENVLREQVNGFTRWGREPLALSIKKTIKSVLFSAPFCAGLFGLARVFERTAPRSRALDRLYRTLLGIHIFRGYRRGLKRYVPPVDTSRVRHDSATTTETVGCATAPTPE